MKLRNSHALTDNVLSRVFNFVQKERTSLSHKGGGGGGGRLGSFKYSEICIWIPKCIKIITAYDMHRCSAAQVSAPVSSWANYGGSVISSGPRLNFIK